MGRVFHAKLGCGPAEWSVILAVGADDCPCRYHAQVVVDGTYPVAAFMSNDRTDLMAYVMEEGPGAVARYRTTMRSVPPSAKPTETQVKRSGGVRVPVKVTRKDVPGRNDRECWSVSDEIMRRDVVAQWEAGCRPVLLLSESDKARTTRYEMEYFPNHPHVTTMTGPDGLPYHLIHAGDAAAAGLAARVS